MKQLYLMKHILGEPNSECLAEIYVEKEIELNNSIIISLDRIITVLENVQIKNEKIDNFTICIIVFNKRLFSGRQEFTYSRF